MSDGASLKAELEALEAEALQAADEASDPEALEGLRVRYLGRKEGRVSGILRGLGQLDPAARPEVGQVANRVKGTIEAAIETRVMALADDRVRPSAHGDLSLPGRRGWIGARHPVTRVIDELCELFGEMGFSRARGPEIETEWYNFEALNTPLDHPAADEQDTLYLADGRYLLRSHTSPVQVRVLQTHEPPIRVLAPGMVFRRDTWDATHAPAFAQLEGLVVDEGVTFVDLKATLAEFARRFWGPGTEVRFRPSFFPFTEPSAEVDVRRTRTIREPDGTVRTEKGDWLEIMGAGMVDPAVLDAAGIDAERYTGFAFGMGPGRIAMLRYGITDIRSLYENDTRFLSQFGHP